MKKVRITESQLKGLVKRMIREQTDYYYPKFGDEGYDLFYDLITSVTTPLKDVDVIKNALEYIIKAGPSKIDLCAYVLLDGLKKVEEGGGQIKPDLGDDF